MPVLYFSKLISVVSMLFWSSASSGHIANKLKSSIFCSPNCSGQTRAAVRNTRIIDRESLSEKYLGLPTSSNWILEEQFEHLWNDQDQKHKGGSRRN
jgi:hypothetical protein